MNLYTMFNACISQCLWNLYDFYIWILNLQADFISSNLCEVTIWNKAIYSLIWTEHVQNLNNQDEPVFLWYLIFSKLKSVKYLCYLTLTLLNFLNDIVHLPFLEMSIINLEDIKMKIRSWSANSIQPGKTAWT